jgi:hypothetical protein
MIQLRHLQTKLWLESNILSNLCLLDTNPKTLRNILDEVKEYAIKRTIEKTGCKKSEVKKEQEYKNTFGWMGEVLCEFWLHTFGHRYDLAAVRDTSENEFQRGFDFTSSVIIDAESSAIIQVKMQNEDRAFTQKALYTFLDEALIKGIRPRNTILMVPTNELPKGEILSWKDDFKKRYSSQIIYIGRNAMSREIRSLHSTIQGNNPNLEFFIRFRDCINNSCKYTS